MLTTLLCAALLQDDAAAHGDAPAPSPAIELSEEARDAMARFQAPEGFRIELYASEPLLANPVAFCFDALGRAYVAETFRHSKGVTDIRSHMDWLEDDLASKTVEDRVAMFRKHEGEDGLAKGYAVETDRVKRIVDTDGDGVADAANVFAGEFTDPAVGIGAGVLARPLPDGGTEVWFTCIPDVWILRDEDGDGVAESRESQSNGYGLRVALLGHDLHGLVIGPDGRMYFSIGDRGFNLTTREGRVLTRYGTGAVFRCELDGANLEIFCDGLRNPQELVFDDLGHLFTLDNNSDGGDKARWTWLLEGSDTGWRQAYQWVNRPHSRGPWNQEKLWEPFHSQQPAYVLPPIANFTSGPSGLTMYPGTGWGEDWRDTFFVCDFRGNPGYSGIYAMENERKGSGFELVNTREFVWDALPTDVDFGPDGDMYWTDWVTGWNQTGKGRMYRVTPEGLPEGEAEMRAQVAALLAGGVTASDGAGLVALFAHRDRRVRQEAQLELARRAIAAEDPRVRNTILAPLVERIRGGSASLTRNERLHSMWCAWHVARHAPEVHDGLCNLITGVLEDDDVELVAQAANIVGDLVWPAAGPRLAPLLKHDDPRVQLRAVEALGAIGADVDSVIELLTTYASSDPWLRHACIRALERTPSRQRVYSHMANPNPEVRRCLAVVLRRWQDPRVSAYMGDESLAVRAEAARAIYDVPIRKALPALAARLAVEPAGTDQPLFWRRMIHAVRALDDPQHTSALAEFAVSNRGPAGVRAEAIEILARWTQPGTRDGIVMDHRPYPGGNAENWAPLANAPLATVEFAEAAASASTDPWMARSLVELHAAFAAQGVAGETSAGALRSIALSGGSPDDVRRSAFEALLNSYPGSPEAAAVHASVAQDVASPLAALSFGALPAEQATAALTELASGEDPMARAEAVRILGSLKGEQAAAAMIEVGQAMDASAPALVEWLEAAASHSDEGVRMAQQGLEGRWADAAENDPIASWRMCLTGGDAAAGKRLFETKSETNCIKCHVIGDAGGSEAGPVLDGLSERLSADEILLSVVRPNDTIAEGFQSWILKTTDGELYSGRIVEETAELVVLEDNKKEQYEFEPSEIETRQRDASAMPVDISIHISRREMRDLMAFLRGL